MNDSVDGLRKELREILSNFTAQLRDGLRAELGRPIRLEEGRPLQFEANPFAWDITSCASEETVFDGDSLIGELLGGWFARAEELGVEQDDLLTEEISAWFADTWATVGGPARFSPAFFFLHDYHHRQFHLETRRWLSLGEVFGM